MFRPAIANRLQAAVGKVCRTLRDVLVPQLPVGNLLEGLATDLLRTRGELIAENAFLRQQLIVASRRASRPPRDCLARSGGQDRAPPSVHSKGRLTARDVFFATKPRRRVGEERRAEQDERRAQERVP